MIEIMFEQLFAGISGARVIAYAADEAVFRQGGPAEAIFQVQEGAVSMVRHLADGSLLTLATASSGETFAEASLFAENYHCDAIARTRSEVLSIPSAALRLRLNDDAVLALGVARFFAGQVRELRTRLEIQRIRSASERVLAWLRWRARGTPPCLEVADAWSRIATELGLTPEALYRALKQLEKAGAIARDGRAIVLPLH